jgi:hypothetical protein
MIARVISLNISNSYDIREDEQNGFDGTILVMEIGADKQLYIRTKNGLLWVDAPWENLDKSNDVKVGLYTMGEYGNGDIESKTMIIRGPGEFDVSGFHIQGWRVGAESTIYIVEVEDVKVAIIPELTDKWDKKKQERIKDADVLLVWGGKIGAKKSRELIKNTGSNHLIVWSEGIEAVLTEYKDEFDLGADTGMVRSVKIEQQSLSESLEVLILNDH